MGGGTFAMRVRATLFWDPRVRVPHRDRLRCPVSPFCWCRSAPKPLGVVRHISDLGGMETGGVRLRARRGPKEGVVVRSRPGGGGGAGTFTLWAGPGPVLWQRGGGVDGLGVTRRTAPTASVLQPSDSASTAILAPSPHRLFCLPPPSAAPSRTHRRRKGVQVVFERSLPPPPGAEVRRWLTDGTDEAEREAPRAL